MAQRATGFAKKPPAARSTRVASPRADSPVALRPIPLNLAPLLAPYKKRGRLSLRIERLPQLARLSGGRNKGDGSWSLAPDELEDLTYLVPETIREPHTIALRIISLDGEAGLTLALLDYLVTPGAAQPDTEDEEQEAPAGTAEPGDLALLHRLRDELAEAKAALAARESDPPKPKEKTEQSEEEVLKERIEAKLAAARAIWKAELDQRLAAASAEVAAELARAREAWEAEQNARVAEPSKTDPAEEKSDSELAKARTVWKAELDKRLAEAAAQAATELATSKEAWEAERKTLIGKQAKTESAKEKNETDVTKARTIWKAELDKRLDEAAANAAAELAKSREAWEAERNSQIAKQAKTESAKGKIETELAAARAAWNAELEARLTAVVTLAASDLARHRDAWQAEESARVAKLEEHAQQQFAEARERWKNESLDALATAEQTWKAGEAARFTEAETRWEEQSEKALAEAHADAAAARHKHDETELRPLREKLAALEATIAARDAALALAGVDAEQTRERWQRENRDALVKAEQTAKAEAADAALKFAAAEAQWKEQSANDLAAATARCEQANVALAAAKAQANVDTVAARAKADADAAAAKAHADADAAAARAQADADAAVARVKADGALQGLRNEMAALRATIADRAAAYEALKQESAATLLRFQTEWKADTETRVTATEAKVRRQFSSALAEATTRFESAEAALALIRVKAARDNSDHSDDLEVNRLRDECSTLQTSLAARETELAQLRAATGQPGEPAASEAKINLRTNLAWKNAESLDRQRRTRIMRRRIGIGAVAACLVAAAIGGLAMRSGGSDVPATSAPAAPSPADVARQPVAAEQRTAVIVRDARVRAGPSTTAAIVFALPRGTTVAIVEQRDKWTRIRTGGEDDAAGARQGWVYGSLLKDDEPRAAPE